MNSRKFIIDFECLLGKDGEYVVKELSIISNVEPFRFGSTMFFKAPYGWRQLSAKAQRTNRWLVFQRHGIRWDAGTTEYHHLFSTLRSLQGDVFVKGLEKAKFVADIVGRGVYELGALGCPKASELRTSFMCPIRSHKGPTNCAEFKCRAYAAWFEGNLAQITMDTAYDSLTTGRSPLPPPPEVALRATDCYRYVDADAMWDE